MLCFAGIILLVLSVVFLSVSIFLLNRATSRAKENINSNLSKWSSECFPGKRVILKFADRKPASMQPDATRQRLVPYGEDTTEYIPRIIVEGILPETWALEQKAQEDMLLNPMGAMGAMMVGTLNPAVMMGGLPGSVNPSFGTTPVAMTPLQQQMMMQQMMMQQQLLAQQVRKLSSILTRHTIALTIHIICLWLVSSNILQNPAMMQQMLQMQQLQLQAMSGIIPPVNPSTGGVGGVPTATVPPLGIPLANSSPPSVVVQVNPAVMSPTEEKPSILL